MPVIIIDGPEKAGKTTVINELIKGFSGLGINSERVHWGPVFPDDRVYADKLMEHTTDLNKVWLWDRGWASEHVYAKLLGRDRRMANDPWIGEWLHSRAVVTSGLCVILTGPHSNVLGQLRDASDIDVSPAIEKVMFTEYGKRFGWHVIENEHNKNSLLKVTGNIMLFYLSKQKRSPLLWCGPTNPPIVVIGETLSKKHIPGGWAPFTSTFTTMLGREFGDKAMHIGWTNSTTCDPEWLRGIETVITCGKIANTWFERNRKEVPLRHIAIQHPSYLYRFKTTEILDKLKVVSQVIRSL